MQPLQHAFDLVLLEIDLRDSFAFELQLVFSHQTHVSHNGLFFFRQLNAKGPLL